MTDGPATYIDPRLGQVIDNRYTIRRRIGAGGTGVVYEAEQHGMGRMVAVKMLSAHISDDQEWAARFRAEAMTCARLGHPNTIRLYDVGVTQDGALYMAMELLTGDSIRKVLSSQGAMPPIRVLRILTQLCASLAEAHSLGIIHRDVKSDNVFVSSVAGASDYVKVLDFSVAKLLHEGAVQTRAGVILGTPQYMSPEQCRGLPLDARSDLYSVGVLAYEMTTGRLPFHHDDPREVLLMHLRSKAQALPDTVPKPLSDIINKALEKEVGNRFTHAGQMLSACERAIEEVMQWQASQPAVQSSADKKRAAGRPITSDPYQKTLVGMPMPVVKPPTIELSPEAKTIMAEAPSAEAIARSMAPQLAHAPAPIPQQNLHAQDSAATSKRPKTAPMDAVGHTAGTGTRKHNVRELLLIVGIVVCLAIIGFAIARLAMEN